jgi:hypothetical protein
LKVFWWFEGFGCWELGREGFAKMGYKAAVKVFKQWKILRGDKVHRWFDPLVSFLMWVCCSFRCGFWAVERRWLIWRSRGFSLLGCRSWFTGTVMKVIRSQNRVLIEGRNLVHFYGR